MKKRRKVVQAHIDAVNEIIEKLIKGEMGSEAAAEYVNKKAKQIDIDKISKYTVQNLIEEILQDRPDKLKEYKENRAKIKAVNFTAYFCILGLLVLSKR